MQSGKKSLKTVSLKCLNRILENFYSCVFLQLHSSFSLTSPRIISFYLLTDTWTFMWNNTQYLTRKTRSSKIIFIIIVHSTFSFCIFSPWHFIHAFMCKTSTYRWTSQWIENRLTVKLKGYYILFKICTINIFFFHF